PSRCNAPTNPTRCSPCAKSNATARSATPNARCWSARWKNSRCPRAPTTASCASPAPSPTSPAANASPASTLRKRCSTAAVIRSIRSIRRAGAAAQRRIPPNHGDTFQLAGSAYASPALQRHKTHASIYPRPHSWRYVLLHGRLAAKKAAVADRTHRCFARGICIRTGTAPLHDRRSGDPSRSFALHLDIAGRRRGFFGSLARHQIQILSCAAQTGAIVGAPHRERRTRHLAAPLLGTRYSRRRRFRATHGLHSLQPGETRACAKRHRLAVLNILSSRPKRSVCAGLERRRQCSRDGTGVTMRRDTLRFSRPTFRPATRRRDSLTLLPPYIPTRPTPCAQDRTRPSRAPVRERQRRTRPAVLRPWVPGRRPARFRLR